MAPSRSRETSRNSSIQSKLKNIKAKSIKPKTKEYNPHGQDIDISDASGSESGFVS